MKFATSNPPLLVFEMMWYVTVDVLQMYMSYAMPPLDYY